MSTNHSTDLNIIVGLREIRRPAFFGICFLEATSVETLRALEERGLIEILSKEEWENWYRPHRKNFESYVWNKHSSKTGWSARVREESLQVLEVLVEKLPELPVMASFRHFHDEPKEFYAMRLTLLGEAYLERSTPPTEGPPPTQIRRRRRFLFWKRPAFMRFSSSSC